MLSRTRGIFFGLSFTIRCGYGNVATQISCNYFAIFLTVLGIRYIQRYMMDVLTELLFIVDCWFWQRSVPSESFPF